MQALDHQRLARMVNEQHGTRGETHLGLVSSRLDRYFATNSVGTADASDDDAH